MTKIAFINDQHFGVRNDNQAFVEYFRKFYDNVFFPTLEEHDISIVIDLGDTFDRRKYINFLTLKHAREMYFDKLQDRATLYSILGNHTTYYKNTNEVNSPSLLLKEYGNITFIENEPMYIEIGSAKLLLVPWISESNRDRCLDIMKKHPGCTVLGHFEIEGFEMDRGMICDHGLDKNLFRNFKAVYSGHFHHPSSYGNIRYLGAPYEMTWSDFEGKRGFHIYDTETEDLTFVQNPYRMFHKIFYDDTDLKVEELEQLDFGPMFGTYVKVIIQEKTNPYIFDLFMDKVQNANPIDIKVVDDNMDLDLLSDEELIDEAQDTRTILNNFIDSVETRVDKATIKKVMGEIYSEAINQ